MRRTVVIAEDEDSELTERDVDHYLTGRFSGYVGDDAFEDLSLDEALAWARERSDRIVVRVGYGPSYAIGFESDSWLPWPREGLPQPPRRRTPDEEWKDRTPADPDATWRATLGLVPPGALDEPRRPEWDEVAASVADRLGVKWSAASFDGWIADLGSGRRANRAFVTGHSRRYELSLTVRAPSADQAREAALAQVPELPDGWSRVAHVEFVG
jgi:hypothetical protein